jgi:hypothetical protein
MVIDPEAVVVIKRGPDGGFHVTMTHHQVTAGKMLHGVPFLVLLLSMAVGAGPGVLRSDETIAASSRHGDRR